MNWHDVQEKYPDQWVVVEALKAFSDEKKRTIETVSVIENTSDQDYAWKVYKELSLQNRNRELYMVHTSNPSIIVLEQNFYGVRARR
ncbi:MAG TPA: hypothetical protein GX497_14255 [Bacillus bacterium]|nr:hypothetical protein [Bacillus sp. (in: firmicutes)]